MANFLGKRQIGLDSSESGGNSQPMAKKVYISPTHHWFIENYLMLQIIRVLRTLDKFFQSLKLAFSWIHFRYFRLRALVVASRGAGGMLAACARIRMSAIHRPCFNNFFLIAR
jgi:hypothetical protein